MIMCNVSYTWFVVEEEEKQDKSITLAFYNRHGKTNKQKKKSKVLLPVEKKDLVLVLKLGQSNLRWPIKHDIYMMSLFI